MMKSHAFSFTDRDSMAQFVVWLFFALCAFYLPIGYFLFKKGGVVAVAISMVGLLVVLVGLRISIAVVPNQVRVTKSWFGLPYWRYTAHQIDEIWFDGEWEGNKSGVVVKLGSTEIHLGTKKTMQQVYSALAPLVAATQAQQAVQPDRRKDTATG